MTSDGFRFGIYATGQSNVMPRPGKFIRTNPPTFSCWETEISTSSLPLTPVLPIS